jgi:hypothetical protein
MNFSQAINWLSRTIDEAPSRDELQRQLSDALASTDKLRQQLWEALPSRDRLQDQLWDALPAGRREPASDVLALTAMLGIGMLVGAGIALLLAPQTGEELRADLNRRLRTDRQQEFREELDEQGGLPGPAKYVPPA